jgi:hypothetical protein
MRGAPMSVFDYQINNVIKTYMKNMKNRMTHLEKGNEGPSENDNVIISDEGMKRVLFERIGERMTERLRRHDQEG